MVTVKVLDGNFEVIEDDEFPLNNLFLSTVPYLLDFCTEKEPSVFGKYFLRLFYIGIIQSC